MREYTLKLARALKVIGLMNHSVRDPERQGVRDRGESARVAHGAVCFEGDGVPLAKIAARLMTGRKLRELLPENIAQQEGSRHGQLLLREVAGVSVGQVSRASIRCLVRR